MAEALTLISGLSAIIQLTDSLVKLTRKLSACVRTIRFALKEISYFLLETEIFTDQLCCLYDLVRDSSGELGEKSKIERAKLVHNIKRQCRFVREDFAHLVGCFVNINTADKVPFNTIWIRTLWLLKKPDVPELCLHIQSTTANVSLMCNLFNFEELKRRNDDDDRLELVQKKLKYWVSTPKRLRHELAEYKRHRGPLKRAKGMELDESSDMIMENTRELEQYVVYAIRSYASGAPLSRSTRSSRLGHQYGGSREARWAPSPRGSRTTTVQIGARNGTDDTRRQVPSQSQNVTTEERGGLRGRKIKLSTPAPGDQRHRKTFGDRARGRGNGMYPHIGKWPEETHEYEARSNDIPKPLEIKWPLRVVVKPNEAVEEPRKSIPKPNSRKPRCSREGQSDVSPQPSFTEERPERSPRTPGGTKFESSRNSQVSLSEDGCDGISGYWKPLPPFGGPESRRPRPQSPVD
ncbi:uncharacterized protein F4822DRAFT_428354 [Hypoxylon trugodes]|uniref:uncharacterized protein n=1 Tax=Hypoxylon trugodes TaxID=326681 RepID=UPI0021934890|nr:uncharacterized protein F4822DRAFT_428354 [Hypoxylon trugodes]KAI1390007.1 hypothetical protein F4822DRAFT_428354 [Hypoxylon trugodes]